mgnify:FL=1
MESLEAQYVAQRWDVTYTARFGTLTLVAQGVPPGSDDPAEDTTDTWEISANTINKSVAESPIVIAGVADDEKLAAIGKVIKGSLSYDEAKKELAGNPYALRVLDQVNKGLQTYIESSYALRHTTNVSNRYGANIADIGVNRIYTTAQLLTETQNAVSWIYPLPGRLAYKLNAIDADFSSLYTIPPNFMLGWLKTASTESSAANYRVNITTDYLFGINNTDIYEPY